MQLIDRIKSAGSPLVALLACTSVSAVEPVPFQDDLWDLSNAQVADHLGREALQGVATLKDVEFKNGTIQVDVAVSGERSYPGVVFRIASSDTYERVYTRPHRAGLYPDSLQYAPIFNGVACWQLFHGEGNTALIDLPAEQWTTIRLEIHESQARVFVGDVEHAQLHIDHLQHEARAGGIGVFGPRNGTAYFSNFSYESSDSLAFDEPPAVQENPLALRDWEISRIFPTQSLDLSTYPRFYQVFYSGWERVQADQRGLVNLSKHRKHTRNASETVYARTFLNSDEAQTVRLSVGYSDSVTVYVNGHAVYSGRNGYRSRDPSFVGAIGPFDTVFASLAPGRNEIMLAVSDSFGGWGFQCTTDTVIEPALRSDGHATLLWETDSVFNTPESVLYDRERQVLYVSNFDKVDTTKTNTGYISKLALDGEVVEHKWVRGLDGPCGMALVGDSLYVVESFQGNLVEISVETGDVLRRIPIPFEHRFLNDITVSPDDRLFLSNTSDPKEPNTDDLYIYENGEFRLCATGTSLHRVNGLKAQGNHLFVGNSGDATVKRMSADIPRVEVDVASLGAGIVDGIQTSSDGSVLASLWQGKLFHITTGGEVIEILDLYTQGLNCADFEYIEDRHLLIIPTFTGNKVVAYTYEPFVAQE
ncbi:MAG: SMP-30/gluconolactonase/LRE family protein [Phycisphaerales bacterium JB043]